MLVELCDSCGGRVPFDALPVTLGWEDEDGRTVEAAEARFCQPHERELLVWLGLRPATA